MPKPPVLYLPEYEHAFTDDQHVVMLCLLRYAYGLSAVGAKEAFCRYMDELDVNGQHSLIKQAEEQWRELRDGAQFAKLIRKANLTSPSPLA